MVELHRRRGYPLSGLVAVQLAEKFVETLSLGLLCGAAAVSAGPGRMPLALGGGLALCGFVLLLALPRRVPFQETGSGVRRFRHALRTVHARQAGAVAALVAAGVAPAPALAVALLYHCVHLVPSTALGLLGMCLRW